METTFGIVALLVVVFVAWKCGVFVTLTKITDMANNEVAVQAATHKATVVRRAADLPDVDEETITKAKQNIAALDAFNL